MGDKQIVKLTYRNKQWELTAGMTVRDAILKCGLNPEQVLAVRGGQLIHEATILKDGDEIKLVAVISGGAFFSATRVNFR
jgi:sulfur carrier protein ThiS